ncbi:hypothetical protein [Nannocystis punicea]|uniref:Uncharacterized protein n=1 Tax=Nannocystis punicea TaxID=2995304 RepID=A0ABY7HBP2_9BACT|nr:hypothetical protein [Nannocystis poenicansa]WAS96690.1 hypothetical protein O0S08_11115 [Nannocystis poenicansa]
MELAPAFSEQFPISSDRFALEFSEEKVGDGEACAACVLNERGDLVATIRVLVWDVSGDERLIRDIKEQQVTIVPAAHLDDPRVPAYFAGWAAALRFAFERLSDAIAQGSAALSDRIESAYPYKMFCPEVLGLSRPQTADDFTEVLLSNRKRLGWLLP